MKEKINAPYLLTLEESQIVKDNFTTHSDWTKNVFDSIKDNIIAFLRIEQDNECCYCKRELGFDIKEVDIEHILPKSKFERFTFFTKNLALSCPACNTKKNANEVLLKPIVRYPKNGKKFKIIHAHYDDYSQHIEILDNCVYVAQTKKGSETITMTELFRLKVVEESAKKFKTEKSILSKLTEELRTANKEDIEGLIDTIKSLL